MKWMQTVRGGQVTNDYDGPVMAGEVNKMHTFSSASYQCSDVT